MPIWQSIILGAVQGLTEFLPVSSTAHLVLIPWVFGWKDAGLSFDVALHLGTLLAVVVYFFEDWVDLVLMGLGSRPVFDVAWLQDHTQSGAQTRGRALFWYLVAATFPAAVAGWLFQKQVETNWRTPIVIALALIIVALLMAWGERISRCIKELTSISLADSLWVGVSQAFALVPGVSRSGITITAGLWRDFKRDAAARFSFLLSTPIIAGAALKDLLDLRHQGIPHDMVSPFIVGIVVAAVVGYACIAYFLRYLQSGTFKIFVYYRVILGIIVLALAFLFHLKPVT